MLNWSSLQPWTYILVHQVHVFAMCFLVFVYVLKITRLRLNFARKELTPARGNEPKGIRYSYGLLFSPWEMECYRRRLFYYLEFIVFHFAVLVAILVGVMMPYLREMLVHSWLVAGMKVTFASGFIVGAVRLFRRLKRPEMRRISTPDDYFSLVLVSVWLATGVWLVNQSNEWALVAFYLLADFSLFYVPFSKISHYIYWPILRYTMGKYFGHRGVFPKKPEAAVTT